MQFLKLRLSGFKSFVDPIELPIEPGLSGIVGPNGCGKSNLVEAIQWVMGESAPKEMRGAEMDDVIFGGTADRPARNIAEASVLLDNSARKAPAALNDADELEVTRRIERGSGSAYRVNGREVRARDVQILFADAATGARSTALVRQGQIGALISAKPHQRRALLEEAAGITGLHSRRHEAELRLRAADTNLARLDDILVTLEDQLQGLRRQTRRAARYRNISDHVRRAEAIQLHLKWEAASAAWEAAKAALGEAEKTVAELTRQAAAAATAQADAAVAMPDLRQAEAEAAAGLNRLALARDGLDAEETRIQEVRRDCETRLSQIAADIEREQALAGDAAAALERLDGERSALLAAEGDDEKARKAAAKRLEAEAAEVQAQEAELTRLTEQTAAAAARQAGLKAQLAELERRRTRIKQRLEEVAAERDALEADAGDETALAAAETALKQARKRLEAARREAEATERARTATREATAREDLQEAEGERAKLQAEEAALAELFKGNQGGAGSPLIDDVTVETGSEAALGAALGDDLAASADESAPVHWRVLPPLLEPTALPAGTEPLSRFVKAPAALARRLSQVGVVADERAGRDLSIRLAPGQRLVSRAGAMWRWDGFTVAADAATAAATRLSQRKRLQELSGELAKAEARVDEARDRFEHKKTAAEAAAAREKTAREALRQAFADLGGARDAHAQLAQQATAVASRRAALAEAAERLQADLVEAEAQATAAEEAQADLADPDSGRTALSAQHALVAKRRAALTARQSESDRLTREAEVRGRRSAEIAAGRDSWKRRTDSAARQLTELEERRLAAEAERKRLEARPEEIAAQRRELLDRLEAAERKRRRAADRLAKGERRLAEADKSLKSIEAELAAAREERVRREAVVAQAESSREAVAERSAERLGCPPAEALTHAGVKPDDQLPELEAVERRLEQLIRERENMGAVNLRAEQEATEVREKTEVLQSEHDDLVQAIARLRRGIAELDREGRERLLASYDAVNRHFQELFVRLFGGGRAHLRLTEAEDPLDAGLEIMASPPGKRLQVISLLSGGEQALAAIALIFAVFLTNPAPVCVLDEVDAPLDDANVDRFCALIEEIAHHSKTRFLLVTHHRMTMARMDRLFGVTMPERGVSQLVSVDLQGAERLSESA